ncbi:MAG TPA: glycosyltransferase family 39 protein [Verrucomicrobiae bacterium]|nr:glycosyltransferase family 39 protein [Verrucomicrobiae bacterium]
MRRLAPLAVAGLAAAYFATFLTYGFNLEDEGSLLHGIARTLGGELPYVDFHTGYTPGVFYLNAGLLRLFGRSVVPIRAGLALVNAATVGLLFTLARPLAGGALAAAAALGYAAFLPFFAGDFASFNIPYPAWYAGAAWLATQAAFDRFAVRGSRAALLAAGLGAGVAFTFKPNSGVFALLACGMALGLLAAGEGDPDRRPARALLVLAALTILVLLAQALAATLTLDIDWPSFPIIAGAPLVLLAGRLLWARARAAHAVRVAPALALLALPAAVVTLPWLAYLVARLGWARFASDVLLIGSGAERIYATRYPLRAGFPALWAPLAAVTIAAVGTLGVAVGPRPRWRGAALGLSAAAALGGGALVAFLARMPEGVLPSIRSEVQETGFFLVPILGLAAVGVMLARLRGGEGGLGPGGRRWLVALVFALVMYLQLYPRVDSMHLILAVPSALVLGAGAAARVARAWEGVIGLRAGRLAAAAAVSGGVLAALAALPNYAPLARPQVAIGTPALPVHVEAEHAADLRALDAVLGYLAARLAPGAAFFGFPAVALVPFALDRRAPTPYDYFFPGRPDHRAEAEVVRTLAAERPPYLLTLNRRLGYFVDAPAYYFILRTFVREHYALVASFGRYDILGWRGEVPPADVPGEPAPPLGDRTAVMAALADPDRELRRLAVETFLARARDAAGVVRLADAWAPDEVSRLLLVRNLGEAGDERALAFLMDVVASASRRLRVEAATALSQLALRARAERDLFGRDGSGLAVASDRMTRALPLDGVRGWMAEPELREPLGVFAAHALAAPGDPASLSALDDLLGERRLVDLRVAAAEALARAGRTEHLCDLVDALAIPLHEVQDVVPSALLDAARTHPAEVAACLARGLADPAPLAREVSAWVAGVARADGVAPALRRALADPRREVRIAAAWATGQLRDGAARFALAGLARDPDPEMGAFAREALARVDGPAS